MEQEDRRETIKIETRIFVNLDEFNIDLLIVNKKYLKGKFILRRHKNDYYLCCFN
jgi:hypothetical protein